LFAVTLLWEDVAGDGTQRIDWQKMILHEKNNVRFTMVTHPEGPWYQVIELGSLEHDDHVHYDGNNRQAAENAFKTLARSSKIVAPEKYGR
jgi:hypothetical protein